MSCQATLVAGLLRGIKVGAERHGKLGPKMHTARRGSDAKMFIYRSRLVLINSGETLLSFLLRTPSTVHHGSFVVSQMQHALNG
jgi:hypothetical protein